jgi:hypothetical protein
MLREKGFSNAKRREKKQNPNKPPPSQTQIKHKQRSKNPHLVQREGTENAF